MDYAYTMPRVCIIDVASYGALGHVPPSTSNCLILKFNWSFQRRTTLTLDSINYHDCQCLLHEFHYILVCYPTIIFS